MSAALIAVTPVVLTARVVMLYFSTRKVLWGELRASVAADADRLATALELPIWNIDRSTIDRVVESTLRTPEVEAVVVDAAGRKHAMRRDAAGNVARIEVPIEVPDTGVRGVEKAVPEKAVPDTGLPETELLRADRDVVLGGTPIGHVTVYATPSFAVAQLRRNVLGHVAGAAAMTVVMVGILWWFLRRVIIQPLRSLEQYAEAVSAGSRPTAPHAGVQLRGEMASLGDTMQHMVALLDTRYAQLEEAEASIHALAARQQVVREEEKTRIARDLHDDLGQLLTAVQMELRWIEERLAAAPQPGLEGDLTDHAVEAARLTEQAARAVQRIAADLRPSVLDRLGLGPALRQEARRFQERTGIPCEVRVEEGLPELASGAATALYRVAQEALTNVARHARASRVAVTLGAAGGEISLRVEDDGRGLDAIVPGPGALGLLGMKERASMLGGDLRFAPGALRGTVVELTVPRARVVAGEVGRVGA